ncbi:MAG: hypothetical protein ACRDQA_19185 [Nocardioidaceae bacterium]
MTGYADGKRVEDKIRDHLRQHGYWVISARASKGWADHVAIRHNEVLFVSVKKSDPQISPLERSQLVRLADLLSGCGAPIVATKPDRKPITYRLLTGTGPKDWIGWTPDPDTRHRADVHAAELVRRASQEGA